MFQLIEVQVVTKLFCLENAKQTLEMDSMLWKNLDGHLLKQNYEFKYIELEGNPQNKMSGFV